jgi:hypothetical protein
MVQMLPTKRLKSHKMAGKKVKKLSQMGVQEAGISPLIAGH